MNQADLQGEGKLEREGVRPQRQPGAAAGAAPGEARTLGVLGAWPAQTPMRHRTSPGRRHAGLAAWPAAAYADFMQQRRMTQSSLAVCHTSLADPLSTYYPALSMQRRARAGLLAGDEFAGDLLPAQGLVTSSEEYYPTVAINALMRTLRDPSMSSHHPQVRTNPYSLLPISPETLREPSMSSHDLQARSRQCCFCARPSFRIRSLCSLQ